MNEPMERYIGLDVHKRYCMVGAVDAKQQVVMPPRKVPMEALEQWARANLKPTDALVFEASVNSWALYDLLQPLVGRVSIVHPPKVKLIVASVVKTDKRDTMALACLLAAHLIPEVWIPPRPVRELRDLVAHRQALTQARSAAMNRLQSILHRHQLVAPVGNLYGEKNRIWWDSLPLSRSERLRAGHLFETIDRLSKQIDETERELALRSVDPLWRTSITLLIQLPGIGLLNAMTILSAIGDIRRFANAKKLVGYAGLGAQVRASGTTHRQGRLTKRGRTDLRRVLVDAAWSAVVFSPVWKARYEKLTARMRKMKAIVAIARKLLVVVWHVLTYRRADRLADLEAVQRSLMLWASTHRLATSLGLRRGIFVQQGLTVLGLTLPSVSVPTPPKTAVRRRESAPG